MKVKIVVSLGLIGCTREATIEVDDEDWADMSDKDREEGCKETMLDMIEWYWEEA